MGNRTLGGGITHNTSGHVQHEITFAILNATIPYKRRYINIYDLLKRGA